MPWSLPSEAAQRRAREIWGYSDVVARAEAVPAAMDSLDLSVLRVLFLDPIPEGLGRRRRYDNYQPNRAIQYCPLRNIITKAIAQVTHHFPTAWALFQIAQAMVGDGAPIDKNNRTDRTPLWLLVYAIKRVPPEWISWFLRQGADPNFTPRGRRSIADLGDEDQRQRFHQQVHHHRRISLPDAPPPRPASPNRFMETIWTDGQLEFRCQVCAGVKRFASAEAANYHVRDTDYDGQGQAPASRVQRILREEQRQQERLQETAERKAKEDEERQRTRL